MPAKEAFIYSLLTGSGYLENSYYPYTPKGLLKVFYNALNFNFVTGIFDDVRIGNTPMQIKLNREYVFNNDKYILPIEFNSDIEFGSILKKYVSMLKNPNDFIVQRIETRKRGNGMEPFLEYLAAEYFKSQGFIVETQIPLSHSLGSPDFGGYIVDDVIKNLKTSLSLSGGLHIIELALMRIYKNNPVLKKSVDETNDYFIVGDAKTSTTTIDNQLDKYLKFGVFDECFEISTLRKDVHSSKYGLITIDPQNYKIRVIKSDFYKNDIDEKKKIAYSQWLKDYFKFYLIANLTNDEFDKYYQDELGSQISDQKDVSDFIRSQTYKQIINRIRICNNGTF